MLTKCAYFEISINGSVQPIVHGAGVARESSGEGHKLRHGKISVHRRLRQIRVDELGDLDERGSALGGVVQGHEPLHQPDNKLYVKQCPARVAERGYHQLLQRRLVELPRDPPLQLRPVGGLHADHVGRTEQPEEEVAGDRVLLRREDSDQGLHKEPLSHPQRGDALRGRFFKHGGGRGLVRGGSDGGGVAGEIREPLASIVGDYGADEVGPYALGFDAGEGLDEVVHVEDAGVVKPAVGGEVVGPYWWFSWEGDGIFMHYC